MGVELASMGITMPADEHDEVVTFSEPRSGTYKKLIVRDGRLVGGIMMGDLGKVAYLMQAFDRNTPLPEERLSLLFDIGAPAEKVTLDEMPANAQVCNCNGVTKEAIGACVAGGQADRQGGDGGDAGRHGLRRLQGARGRAGRVLLRWRGRGGPLDPLLRAEHPDVQAGAGQGRQGAGAEVGFGRAPRALPRRTTRPPRSPWPRC